MKIYSCPQCMKEFETPLEVDEGESVCVHCGRTIVVLPVSEMLKDWQRVFVKSE